MRGLFWVLLIAALAVAVTVGARYNAGYVLLVLHPYRVEMSLNFLLALLVLLFAAGYALLRVVSHTLRLPDQVREFRQRRRVARTERALLDALRAFLEGRYAQAEKAAVESIDLGRHVGIGSVLAARAAHELRAYDRRDRHLARAAKADESDRPMLAVARAELLLQERRHQEALAALDALPRKHTAALRLELRAVQLARNWDRYLELLAQLDKLDALEPVQAAELRRHGICENLARKAVDPRELREYWQRLPQRDRQDGKIAAEAARQLIALGETREVPAIVEASLEREWDSVLVPFYAEGAPEDTLRRIERAEGWLKARPQDAALLHTLGLLCARQRLWGKARSYFEASLSVEESLGATIALAQLLVETGDEEGARLGFRRSLELAQAQLEAVRPGAYPSVVRATPPAALPPG